jgi:hypothetical protein
MTPRILIKYLIGSEEAIRAVAAGGNWWPLGPLLVLLTDFEEGGSVASLLSEIRAVVESGVTALGLAALDDDKRPRFSSEVAARVVSAGMPVASLSPVELARWVAERIRGEA